jgi:hypothetical protein
MKIESRLLTLLIVVTVLTLAVTVFALLFLHCLDSHKRTLSDIVLRDYGLSGSHNGGPGTTDTTSLISTPGAK